jgi:hypothetical protein
VATHRRKRSVTSSDGDRRHCVRRTRGSTGRVR